MICDRIESAKTRKRCIRIEWLFFSYCKNKKKRGKAIPPDAPGFSFTMAILRKIKDSHRIFKIICLDE